MATRDILVLNTTASRAETQQGSDTVVIQGNSGQALSVENSSGTSILSVNTLSSSVDVAGKITATTNVSSSLSSTGSFGRLEATTLVGDAFNLTGTAIDGTISSSAQIANQISGSFRRGFEFTGTIGDTIPDQENRITASFGRIVATSLSGSAANLTNTDLANTISSSAQIASRISGSFTSGFDFENSISGSATSTGSFQRVDAIKLTGDVSQMTNLVKPGLVSGSAQIASNISGSFQKGFEFDGHISGSASTTASFANVFAKKAIGDISGMYNLYPVNTISSSAQLASNISGSFALKGFEFTGTISGSATSTGSFHNVFAKTIHGDISNMTNILSPGVVSSSAQVASNISGSFNKGFEFTGIIDGKLKTWAFGTSMGQGHMEHGAVGNKASALVFGGYQWNGISTTNSTEEWNGSNWSYGGNYISARTCMAAFGISTEAAIAAGGSTQDSEEYNGSAWSEIADTIVNTRGGGGTGTTEAGIVAGRVTSPYQQTETFNGTNWSEVNDLITGNAAGFGRMIGTQNAGYYKHPGAGGNTSLCTQEWNGTNWSEVNDSNTQRTGGGGFAGSVNDAWLAGGHPSTPATTEEWDGTAWSNLPASSNLNCIRRYSFGIGLPSAGMQTGGQENPNVSPYADNVVEEFTHATGTGSFGRVEATSISGDGSNLTNSALAGTISGSAQLASLISGSFTSGFTFGGNITNVEPTFAYAGGTSNVSDARWRGASGIQNAGLAFGGQTPTRIGDTETFDGTTWTEVNNLNTTGPTVGGGTTNATVAFGGWYRGACTETWDGTSWSEVNDLIISRGANPAPIKMSHSQNAALAAGGTPAPYPNTCTEEWNGTNWSSANELIKAMTCADGFGTPAGGVAIGTDWPLTPFTTNNAVLWNGLNWSEGPLLPPSGDFIRMTNAGTAGAENDGIVAGQCQYQAGAYKAGTACYNGISFNLGNDLPQGCAFHRGAGTNVANAWFVGGATNSSPYYPSSGFTVSSGVASASFSHIEATRISASVDGMTNIHEPSGTISGSAQIASSISGSFSKGFEFSGEIKSLGVFSAGGDFPGHYNSLQHSALFGTRNAALLGGGMGYYQASKCDTYTYNGTSWSDTGANMICARGGYSGIGTQDAALAAGGNTYKDHIFRYLRSFTEEWNGSAWSENTNLPHQLTFLNHQSAGTQNAAFIAGGYTGTGANNEGSGSEAFQQTSLAWDGLSYTTVGSMANERASGGVVGSINAALAQGANNSLGHSTCTEEWNGSAWSDAAASNFPTSFVSTVGTSNNAMHVLDASSPLKAGCSDFYNGVSWSTGPLVGMSSPSAYKQCTAAGGSTSAGLFLTFNNSCVEHFDEYTVTSSIGRVDATELSLESDTELTVNESLQIPQYATNPPITSSAGEVWYNTDEEKLYFTYDINSWTEVAATNITHNFAGYAGGTGDGIAWGGFRGAPLGNIANSEVWNGVSWTEVNDLNTAGGYTPGGGSSNAAIAAGRNNPGLQTITEIWDGTSWTEVNDGAIGYGASFAGTVNAAVQTGGRNGSAVVQDDTKEWNGTSWYAGGDMITARANQAAMLGTQNAAKHMGGTGPDAPLYVSTVVEDYNGTSFSTATPLLVGTYYSSGGGTQNAGIMAGGLSSNSPTSAQTYEWNGVSFHQTANLVTGRHTNDIADGSQSSFQVSSGGPFNGSETKTEQYTTTGIGCHCIGGV